MAESSWEKSQKGRFKFVKGLIILLLVIPPVFLIIYNNREAFSRQHQKSSADETSIIEVNEQPVKVEQVPVELSVKQSSKKQVKSETEREKIATIIEQESEPVSKEDSTTEKSDIIRDSVLVQNIKCSVAGRKDIRICFEILLFTNDSSLKREVLIKRDDLKVMVMKTVRKMELNSIKTGSLRNELRGVINGMLENGTITDLEFRDFRIEEVK